jgi:hypothetical protein
MNIAPISGEEDKISPMEPRDKILDDIYKTATDMVGLGALPNEVLNFMISSFSAHGYIKS